MMRLVDRLSAVMAAIAACLFFVIGVMITYEVIMRKLFNAPTIWVEEITRFLLIWATYIAAAYLLHHRELIVVEIGDRYLGQRVRRVLEVFALLVVGAFCAIALWYGIEILLESIRLNRATATMLGVPQWMTESAIPIGFGLLLLQCLVEIVRLLRGDPLPDASHHAEGSAD